MLCSTSCAAKRELIAALPDPAKLAGCPATFPAPPVLTPLAAFTLPDGRRAVLLDTVIARETATARYIVETRGVWQACRSPLLYVEDWMAVMSIPTSAPK